MYFLIYLDLVFLHVRVEQRSFGENVLKFCVVMKESRETSASCDRGVWHERRATTIMTMGLPRRDPLLPPRVQGRSPDGRPGGKICGGV